jgi:hypothetical protein
MKKEIKRNKKLRFYRERLICRFSLEILQGYKAEFP